MKKKICKKYGWILIWGLVSIVFAAVLQFLFSLEAPIPFLQAKWSAGDILTYSSTILLGLLALWQNQRFKNENDATQEKLEALSTRANELQITSKLIEHEAERINLLRTQFQTFFDACACNYLVADYKDTAKGEKRYAYYSTLRSSQIRTSYQVLWQQLNMDKGYNSLVDDVIKNAQRLSASAMGLMLSFTLAQDGDTSENDTKETARQMQTQLEIEEKLIEDGRVYFGADGGNTPRLKRYLADVQQGMTPTTIWKCDDVGHNQEGRQELKKLFDDKGYFDSPKPQRLMHRILKVANLLDNSIVLDFFSGSASTAHAVMQLNAEDGGHRKFIMVQLPEKCDEKSEAYKAGYKNICEIGKERIRRAGAKIKEEAGLAAQNLDTGFRVLKCDTSNMKDVYYNPAEYEVNMFSRLEDNIKEDRTPEDLLFQVMLDLGVLLSSKIEETTIAGKKVFNVEDNYLIACFDSDVSEETIKAIAKQIDYMVRRKNKTQ